MNNIEQKLGFDRIRQMVAEQCTNALAARMAEEMRFMTDHEQLCHELQLTEEMRQIVLMESEFPQQDFIDLTPILTHLRVGNTVIPLESLFDLKLSLRTIRECYQFLTAEEHVKYTALRDVAIGVELGYGGKSSQLNVINSLLGKLIDDHGELYDNASPALAEIRRTKARKAAEVDAQVNSTLARAKREGWAPEGADVTIRDGTYSCRENFGKTIAHCRDLIKDDRLKGFLMAPWYYRTQEDCRAKIMESLDVMAEAIRQWKS